MVAESTEILRPIDQFGCLQASSGVTCSSVPTIALQEGAAGRGQQDLRHAGRFRLARVVAGQRLEDRIVLAVDRQQGRLVLAHGVHEQLAGHHQRFLVGQQDLLAGARGGQGRRQAGGADDGGHHGVGVRAGRDVAQGLLAVGNLGRQVGDHARQPRRGLGRLPTTARAGRKRRHWAASSSTRPCALRA
jgi:hypothetical protein